jgi:DNA-binding SARP family transcriptional activator
VEATSTNLVLAPDVAVDVREAVRLARFVLEPAAEVGEIEVSLPLLSADLLPGWYDDWVLIRKEWFRQLRLHALERLSERLIEAGKLERAVEAAVLAVAGEPLRETARRALIHAHFAEGNIGEAIREYAAYRDLLRSELGVVPSPLMQDLVKGLRV